MTYPPQPQTQPRTLGRVSRYAWLPIPLSVAVIAGLWVADLRTVYESRAIMVLLNLFFTWLASLCICILTARGFFVGGQPGLLMFGCGSLLWGATSLAAAVLIDSNVNPSITVHNVGVFGAALCHFVGSLCRRRLPRPGRWLVAGYASALMTAALIVWAATAGLTPVFFVQGEGGTPVRQGVLLLATALFAWVAGQMIYKFRRQSGAFYYWYGLGLGLVATGLTGVMLLSVQGSILGWTNRLAQYFGSAYLLIAALTAARETGTRTFSLTAVDEALQQYWFMAGMERQSFLGWLVRYGLAVMAAAAAMGLRLALTAWVGPGLPTYITFYPAVMVTALLGGFGPGLVITALTGSAVCYWILSPVGQFAIASPVDRMGWVLFSGMGLFISATAELYRRNREKAAAYDRETALRESRERLAAFAEATFEGIVESQAGRIVDCNEQFARMLGYSVAELRGREISELIAPEDLARVSANIGHRQESVVEHVALRKDGTRIVVEAHGRPVSSGNARRYTAVRDLTQRRQAQAALAESEQRYRTLFETLMEGFCIIEVVFDGHGRPVDYRFLEVNPAFEKQTGLQDARGKLMRDLAPEHEAHWFEVYGKIALTGEPVRFVNEARALNRWFDVSAYRLGAAESRTVAILFSDITESHRAAAALRESEERHRVLAETMLQGVVHQDADGKIIAMNPAAERILGRSREQFVGGNSVQEEGHTIRENGERFPGMEQPAMAAVQTGQPVRGVTLGVWNPQKNARRWINIDAVPVFRVGEARPAGVYTVFEDITERKRAEEGLRKRAEDALRMSEEEFRSLAEAMPQIVWATRSDGWNIYFNQQWMDYTGMTMEESYGHGWNRPFHPEDKERAWEAWQRATQYNERYSLECRLRRADGVYRWWLIRGVPMRGANGEILKWFGTCTDIEEIKRAEAALQEANDLLEQRVVERTAALQKSQQLLQDVMDGSPSPIFLKDSDGKFLTINTSLEKMLGMAREDLKGKTDYDIAPQEVADHWRAHDKQVMETGKGIQIEEVADLPDGHHIFLANKFPLVDANGQIYGVGAISHEITDRKWAEERLRRSEEQLHVLADSILNLAWWANADGYITWYNRRWYEYTGTTPQQMEGWGWQSVHDPQALPAVMERWQASIATGGPFEMTFPLRGADGRFRSFLTRVQPLKDAQGRVVQWFGTNTDVEELKRSEEALREAEQRLRFALETSHTGAWDLDLVDHTAFRSQEHDRVFGYSELLPHWTYEMFLQHVQPEDRAAVDEKFRQATVTQGVWDFECRIRRADGEVRWIWGAGRHRTDAAGGNRRMVGIVQDITARKRAEERLETSLHEKEVLLKEIHHRVKNNLQVIASLVDLQTNTLDDPGMRGHFRDVRDRVRSMALVHEKLYQSENLASVEFADYARSLLEFLSKAHRSSQTIVELTLDLQPVPLSVETAVPCGLILNELVTNAFKHAFRGRTKGEITTALHSGSDGRVCLRVSDDGVGLPEGIDWRQSHSLGLRLIHLLAGQLNATVEVRPGGGADFLIIFAPSQPKPAKERKHA